MSRTEVPEAMASATRDSVGVRPQLGGTRGAASSNENICSRINDKMACGVGPSASSRGSASLTFHRPSRSDEVPSTSESSAPTVLGRRFNSSPARRMNVAHSRCGGSMRAVTTQPSFVSRA